MRSEATSNVQSCRTHRPFAAAGGCAHTTATLTWALCSCAMQQCTWAAARPPPLPTLAGETARPWTAWNGNDLSDRAQGSTAHGNNLSDRTQGSTSPSERTRAAWGCAHSQGPRGHRPPHASPRHCSPPHATPPHSRPCAALSRRSATIQRNSSGSACAAVGLPAVVPDWDSGGAHAGRAGERKVVQLVQGKFKRRPIGAADVAVRARRAGFLQSCRLRVAGSARAGSTAAYPLVFLG